MPVGWMCGCFVSWRNVPLHWHRGKGRHGRAEESDGETEGESGGGGDVHGPMWGGCHHNITKRQFAVGCQILPLNKTLTTGGFVPPQSCCIIVGVLCVYCRSLPSSWGEHTSRSRSLIWTILCRLAMLHLLMMLSETAWCQLMGRSVYQHMLLVN